MSRVKRGVTKHARHKKIMKAAKGFSGASSRSYRSAHEALMHAWAYSYRHRRERKGDFRRLWITRINAACRQLRENDDTISTVALRCGFYDHSYFTKQFVKHMGRLPKAYRAREQAETGRE